MRRRRLSIWLELLNQKYGPVAPSVWDDTYFARFRPRPQDAPKSAPAKAQTPPAIWERHAPD